MSEIKEDKQNSIMHELMQENLRSLDEIENGQLVTGTVIQVDNECVFVDVGLKSEGRINIDEFPTIPEVNDQVNVVIVSKAVGNKGYINVSKKKADMKLHKDVLKNASTNNEAVAGKFVKVIKGGFEVDLDCGFKGFCPLSKADIVRVENPESLIGITDYFLIDKFNSGKDTIKSVVNRRACLDSRIKANKEKFFSEVKIGDVVEGVVKSFTSFGAFIDLGGFDGLLHINDMSWGHVTKPKDFVKKGDQIQLRLINIDPETQKINLSLKHMQEDPWISFEQKFQVGSVVKAPVTKLTTFGVFIEIAPGVEGLAHISELSWTKRVVNPKDVVKIGDVVQAQVLGYDLEKRRVSLGLKQLQENPWDTLAKRYPLGKVLKLKVVKVTNTGAFLNIEEGIDGFLQMEDISWSAHEFKTMSEFCKEGDLLDVTIIKVDNHNKRVRLGIKQLEGNPWKTLKDTYKKGDIIKGEVSNVTNFGVFVNVVAGIEGLISKYNLVGPDEKFSDEVLKNFKVGDEVTAMIVELNPMAQKLGLSIKDMIRKSQESEFSKYIQDDKDDSSDTYNPFADLLNKDEK